MQSIYLFLQYNIIHINKYIINIKQHKKFVTYVMPLSCYVNKYLLLRQYSHTISIHSQHVSVSIFQNSFFLFFFGGVGGGLVGVDFYIVMLLNYLVIKQYQQYMVFSQVNTGTNMVFYTIMFNILLAFFSNNVFLSFIGAISVSNTVCRRQLLYSSIWFGQC